jgi:hypothetical protein
MWTLATLSARKSSEVRKSAEVQPPGGGVAEVHPGVVRGARAAAGL